MEMTHWNDPPRHSVRLPSVPPRLARFLPWIALGAIAFGVLNAGWQMSESASLGGDALNGFVRDGHYFVGSHGSYTEVGAAEWIANRNRGALTLISWPFVMLAAAFLLFRYVFPYVMSGGRTQRPDQERVARIRGSGPMLASADPGGRVGEVHMTIGMLGVDVYDAGLVIRPRFMPPFAIPVEEIRSVRHGRSLLSKRLEIEHDGLEVPSTVGLFIGEDSHVARAIAAITEGRQNDPSRTPLRDPRSGSTADPPAVKPGPPILLRLLSLTGLFVGVAMIIVGVTRIIPAIGLFGIVWTAFGVVILAVNAAQFVRRGY
jgi:hypothetical protein